MKCSAIRGKTMIAKGVKAIVITEIKSRPYLNPLSDMINENSPMIT